MHPGRSPGNDTEAQLAKRTLGSGCPSGSAVVGGALRGPLMSAMRREQSSNLLPDDRIPRPSRDVSVFDDQVDAPGALRIPAIGLEVDARLCLGLSQGSASIAGEPGTFQRREPALVRQRRACHGPAVTGPT